MKKLLLIFCMVTFFSLPAMAQEGGEEADYQKRIELAKKMHEIRPVDLQVEEVSKQLAGRFPEDQREKFMQRMSEVFQRDALTEISVKAMADTFTAAELEKMVDFHGSPEGRSISEKMPVYQAILEPELIKKIDRALMEIRTGKAGDIKLQ